MIYGFNLNTGFATPRTVFRWDLFNQSADIALNALTYNVPANAMYQVLNYVIITVVDGVSSTLPAIRWNWTDADTSVNSSGTLTASTNSNALGVFGIPGSFYPFAFNAKGGTTISPFTSGYASGTPGQMKFAFHVRLILLG